MAGDLSKDWLVYVLIAGMAWFFIYMIIIGNRDSKNGKQKQDNSEKRSGQDKKA